MRARASALVAAVFLAGCASGPAGTPPASSAAPDSSVSAGASASDSGAVDPGAPSDSGPSAAASGQVYVVKKGDVLSKVAANHGVTLRELLAANPQIKEPDKIAIGDKIIIPGGGGSGGPSASPSETASASGS